MLTTVLLACSIAAVHAAGAQAQHIPPDDLRALGIAAYDRLPAVPTMQDAKGFSQAVQYLFAYEQRSYRAKTSLAPDAAIYLAWMLNRLDAFRTGKADEPIRLRDDDALRTKGMELYERVKASQSNGVIWEVSGFISARANLFAYLQCADAPDGDARRAFAWLSDPHRQLVVSGGKGDSEYSPGSWLARAPRPGARKSRGARGATVPTRQAPSAAKTTVAAPASKKGTIP